MEYWREIDSWKDINLATWMDWKWQLRNSVRSPQELTKALGNSFLFDIGGSRILASVMDKFGMKLTPYVVTIIYRAFKTDNLDAANALLRAFVPTTKEAEHINNGVDGIGEETPLAKPVPLVTNFYKNRILLFITNRCPTYCRFCFRRRKVGDHLKEGLQRVTNQKAIQEAIKYIRENQEIKEVIISGGDPLTLNDDKLSSLLQQLKEIKHIKVLRIDTKAVTTLPQRITPELVERLKKYKPIYIVGNFLHPAEVTPEVIKATSLLIDAGIPVVSHTAFLKGINDDPEIISELMWKLFVNRIIPYYLIQFIPTRWTEHFRVPVQKGLDIIENLHGRLPGIANPAYIVYLPDGAGKVPLLPNYLLERTTEGYYFKNFEGKKVLYKEQIEL